MSIHFKKEKQLDPAFQYPQNSNEVYLHKLLNTYDLESLIDEDLPDFENIIKLQSWVHSRWEHDSENKARKNDAIYILEQAEAGKRFRCAEYATVSKACLRALGFTVRELILNSRDTDLVKKGTTHSMNEVYLDDLKKWFFIDPCFDIMVKSNGIPLNAVELLQAMINEEELEVINPSNEVTCGEYLEKIGPFLGNFSTCLDQNKSGFWSRLYRSRNKLTLVPLEEGCSTDFQQIKIPGNLITHSIADFYPEI